MRVILLIILTLCLVGCGETNDGADRVQAKATATAMAEAQRQVGMPGIINFQQRRLMKMILEECDKEGLLCYAYLQSAWTGQLVYLGRCMGYGVPFSAQFTNPERQLTNRHAGTTSRFDATIPQPDPNGLFMPTSSEATWLLLIDTEGNPRVCYGEPELFISPFALPIGVGVIGGPDA